MAYRVVVADDEPLARRGVRARLRAFPLFSIERECSTGDEALAAISELKPDLAFLDVQMPGLSGLDVARAIARHDPPSIIFTTAYEQYALSAFEAHAIDYLLKPLEESRFARALERARRLIQGGAAAAAGRPSTLSSDERSGEVERFWVKSCGRVVLVPVSDVDWISAEGDYVRLHVRDKSYLISDSLTALQARLEHAGFARIHRCTIVNIARVAELRPHMNQDHTVRLATGVDLRLSRTYYGRFKQVLR